MALSQEILDLLKALAERNLAVDFPIAAVEGLDEFSDGFTSEERNKFLKNWSTKRNFVRALVETRMGPALQLNEDDEILAEISEGAAPEDYDLDEHFTISVLREVPRIVARWKKLRGVRVRLLPGPKVRDYVRQASLCYLYGLFDATAILSRAVLQFALEEAFSTPGGISLGVDTMRGKDRLEMLIDFAGKTKLSSSAKILPLDLVSKAHGIRRLGNKSVHKSSCDEKEALAVITDTVKILKHIYGNAPKPTP